MDVPEAETLNRKVQLRQNEHRLHVLNLAIKYRNRKVRVLFNFFLFFFFLIPNEETFYFLQKKERHLIPEKKNKEQRTKKCRVKLYHYY